MAPKVKTILTSYLVKVNNEIVDTFSSLREARQFIKILAINDDINIVHIIKQSINETILDTYETKTTKVLIATQLDEGIGE